MRIAITAKGTDLDAEVDPRFGRCQYFVIVDPETMEFSAAENPAASAMGGAGPLAVQEVSRLGADALVTGNLGPNAYQAVEASGIRAYTGSTGGTVRDAVEAFRRGELAEARGATSDSHAGMR